MLTEKDYCDYELRLGLRDIGYPMSTCQINDGPIQMPKITLYEAQKWLREEKSVIIVVYPYCYTLLHEIHDWTYEIWLGDNLESQDNNFDYYEEALSEGIKEAVKILKEK